MHPLLSIITIKRNNGAGLQKTIESVVQQSYLDFEFTVIDGASCDNSVDILKKYSGKCSWVSEQDSGIFNAINKGIAKSSGDYFFSKFRGLSCK